MFEAVPRRIAAGGFRAGWFVRLHKDLAPGVEGIAARRPAYDLLLRSPVGTVVAAGLARTGAPGDPAPRAWLAGCTGTSKAATAARAVLAGPPM